MSTPEQTTNTTPTPTKLNLNLDYVKTPAGLLRVCEAVVALAGIISGAIGADCDTDGKVGFYLFVVVASLVKAAAILIIFLLRLDAKVATLVNVPLSLFINDAIWLVFYFLASILMMLSMGDCHRICYRTFTARVFASLFGIANFLVLVGLLYMDYIWVKSAQIAPKEPNTESNGTTVTETSPTVLALH